LKQVSVIIPNWNGKDFLGPCLESVYRQEFKDLETIIIDNGSSDGSVSFVENNFPQVRVIRFEQNTGFSSAVNAGILASSTPYVAMLNNDTEVHPLWLKELVASLETDPKAGSAASKILFSSDRHSVNSAGDEFSWFGVAYHRRLARGDAHLYDEPRYVFSACGAAALFRKELFDAVGLFDESFFAYQEDVDLGFRAQLLGYRCLFVPRAIVYHKSRMTSSRVIGLRFYLNQRNKYFVLIKNFPAKLFILCLPLILLFEGFCLLRAIVSGHLIIYFKALKGVSDHFPEMFRRRRQIQANRIKDDTYIRSLLRFREPFRIFLSGFGAFLLERP